MVKWKSIHNIMTTHKKLENIQYRTNVCKKFVYTSIPTMY